MSRALWLEHIDQEQLQIQMQETHVKCITQGIYQWQVAKQR